MKIWLRIYRIDGDLDSCGMGRIYIELLNSFRDMGIDVVTDNPKEKCLELCIGGDWKPSKIDGIDYGNVLFGLTTGETDLNDMPYSKLFDHLFVCSEYYKSRQTINKPITVWHLGINPKYFPYIKRNNESFTFSHIGISQYRKGSHLACMAFDRAFRGIGYLDVISGGETEFFHALKQIFSHNSHIRFKSGYVPKDDISSLYYGDCLVFPSIREGWGLHLTEAMATGMPAIVSDLPVLKEQFSDSFGWKVKIDDNFEFVGGNLPDINDLQEKMVYAYLHRNECFERGKLAHEYTHKYLTWEYGIKNSLIKALSEANIKISVPTTRN